MPKVSVIMPVYNSEKCLKESVQSILNQIFKDFELIIINDGSTDKTLNIVKHYASQDKRIIIIEKEHTGITDSLNVGLRQARGEWIARLDADDIAFPERISQQLRFVERNTSIGLIGASCLEINGNGEQLKQHFYPEDHNELMTSLEKGSKFFPHSSAFFNHALVKQLGYYNPKFTMSQDRDLWLRIGENAHMACLKKPLIKLRKYPQVILSTHRGRAVMSSAAAVCHLRRKARLSDPSQMDKEIWKKFLKWIEYRLEAEGYLQWLQGWRVLRNVWYANPNTNKVIKSKVFLSELVQNPLARKALWAQFWRKNFLLKVTEESKRLQYL